MSLTSGCRLSSIDVEKPLSSTTLIGGGKARVLGALCGETGADLVFWNGLSARQREALERVTGVAVQGAAALG